LIYHAQGVLCSVTAAMHLAAAIETKPDSASLRPCIVVAGGREPSYWEAYPNHQFVHTIGALPCCLNSGCWRARTLPLGDGDKADDPSACCLNVVGDLPKCMDMIAAQEVIRRIGMYFDGGAIPYLTSAEARAAARGVSATASNPFDDAPLNIHNAKLNLEQFIRRIPPFPGTFDGRGVVICCGGFAYFVNAWVCVRMLRWLGCTLPVQVWYRDREEMDDAMICLLDAYDVECVDANRIRGEHPVRRLGGWELKPYAILHSPFSEVLLLDADNVPIIDPTFLFLTKQFRETGAVFWPDYPDQKPSAAAWAFCGISEADDFVFETGQILVNKARCWDALSLTMWFNEHSDFYYQHFPGGRETFHVAFRKLRKLFSMPTRGAHALQGTVCQHDFRGRRIFQHRNADKWRLYHANRRSPGFRFERRCLAFVEELRSRWDGRINEYGPRCLLRRSSEGGGKWRSVPSIGIYIITCRERDRLRAQTLRSLAASDWKDRPVRIQMDRARFADRRDRICDTAWLALNRSLRTNLDYVLLLEDDLVFNRFLRHNLLHWRPLREGMITVAGLYNQDLKVVAYDVRANFVLVDPQSVFGSQAFLIARESVEYLVAHWHESREPLDFRLSDLAAGQRPYIIYHTPSLVQHVGKKSVWGGRFCEAIDYDPLWKAEASS
jgi:hypothetical protein